MMTRTQVVLSRFLFLEVETVSVFAELGGVSSIRVCESRTKSSASPTELEGPGVADTDLCIRCFVSALSPSRLSSECFSVMTQDLLGSGSLVE